MNINKKYEKYFVIDTNIILEDANNIFKISSDGDNLIIIPETVLDEIDSKKSGFNEINFQAREFARILEDNRVINQQKSDEHAIISMVLKDEKTRIDIISKENYKVRPDIYAPNIFNDRKILEIAEFSNSFYSEKIIFLSLDMMAQTRALSLQLKTENFVKNKHNEKELEFYKKIVVSYDEVDKLADRNIFELDSEYKPENFSYGFLQEFSDHMILAVIKNKKTQLLDETELRNQIITPLNKEQLFFSHSINDPFYNVIVVEAKAGSGKTLLALSGSMKLIRRKDFKKIIYIRNSIESLDKGEDVGYLPGLEEKFKIYNHPLMDSLDYIVRTDYKRKKKSKNQEFKELEEEEVKHKVEEVINQYGIETMWVGEMRGRTLSNAVIIVDEAQNISNKTMQMVLSRVDSSCKVIILGSNKQIDNFYINKHTNSLTTLLQSTQKHYEQVNLFSLRLNKVLRGPITEWAENIFKS
jgi:PhoH-like ATPase